jgi:hypothetical protein
MGHINAEIELAIRNTGARASALSEHETAHCLTAVDRRFAHRHSGSALWDRLIDSVGYQDVNGWRMLSEYRPDDPCTLFVPPHLESTAFLFECSRDVSPVLRECSGFVVYVAASSPDSLLCFNDHDFIIAAGDAKGWLSTRYAKP